MLKKKLKKIKNRKNKKEKAWKEAVEKQRVLPRSRQIKNVNEKKVEKKLQFISQSFLSKKNLAFSLKQ